MIVLRVSCFVYVVAHLCFAFDCFLFLSGNCSYYRGGGVKVEFEAPFMAHLV